MSGEVVPDVFFGTDKLVGTLEYDFARFGSERPSFSPRQADLLMVMGTIAKKMGPVLKQVYLQMAEPRWVIAVGACALVLATIDAW